MTDPELDLRYDLVAQPTLCPTCNGIGFHVAVGHQLGTVPMFTACTACGEAGRRKAREEAVDDVR